MEDVIAAQIRDELQAIRKALEAIAIIMYQKQNNTKAIPKSLPSLGEVQK